MTQDVLARSTRTKIRRLHRLRKKITLDRQAAIQRVPLKLCPEDISNDGALPSSEKDPGGQCSLIAA